MKKTIALIDCSIPINSRNQKIINSIKENFPNSDIHVITWNREGLSLAKESNLHVYNHIAAYADAKAKVLGMFGFKKFIKATLNEIHADIIIASHWSNLILVVGTKQKDQTIIYENLDIPTGGFLVRKISQIAEKWALRKVDLIIHASRFFKTLYSDSIPQIVLENKPAFTTNFSNVKIKHPLRISFIGSIRYKEILTNLVEAVKNDKRYQLYFHGSGEDLNYMRSYCSNIKNVFFTGKYLYENVTQLYHNSDVVWAAYPNKDFNVVYAISNKFHESLYVGIPCIYSDQTKLAELVKEKNIGFVVNPYDISSIKNLFSNIYDGTVNMEEIKENMKTFHEKETTWETDFQKLKSYLE